MFQTNPQNDSNIPNDLKADRARSDSKGESSTFSREFSSRKEFAAWLDLQLELLEEQFAAFETRDSRRNHFRR